MSTTEDNKAIARRFLALSDRLALGEDVRAEMLEMWAPDAIHHAPGNLEMDTPSYLQFLQVLASAFPQYYHQVEDQIAEGDKVVTRLTLCGTHTGNFRGIPPTGRQVRVSGINILRIVEGKIVEAWAISDNQGLMQQLGVIKAQG